MNRLPDSIPVTPLLPRFLGVCATRVLAAYSSPAPRSSCSSHLEVILSALIESKTFSRSAILASAESPPLPSPPPSPRWIGRPRPSAWVLFSAPPLPRIWRERLCCWLRDFRGVGHSDWFRDLSRVTDTHVGFLSPNERVDPDEREREREREGERSDQSELRRRLRGREEGKEGGHRVGDRMRHWQLQLLLITQE